MRSLLPQRLSRGRGRERAQSVRAPRRKRHRERSVTASALYCGRLAHVRRRGGVRSFEHELYMLYLDLDELGTLELAPLLGVESLGVLSFRRRDYFGAPERPLKQP